MAKVPSFKTTQRRKQERVNKDLPPTHPINNQKNADRLIEFIKDRLDFANLIREELVEGYTRVDKEIVGYQTMSKTDLKRELDNQKGKGPLLTKIQLQLTEAQLDEIVTYLLEVFAPEDGIYKGITSKEKQPIANAFSTVMNEQAARFQHYRHYALGFTNATRYNWGGWITEWSRVLGKKLGNTTTGALQVETNKVVAQGNSMFSLSPYNTLWDISVRPSDVPMLGEFFATVNKVRDFPLRKMETLRELFGVERGISETGTNPAFTFYHDIPEVRGQTPAAGDRPTNWHEVLTGGQFGGVSAGYELINYYGWLKPSDFNLDVSEELEVWRITVLEGRYIVGAAVQNFAHGMLPAAFTTPKEDELGFQTKSYAEVLNPLQRFASFLINIHQAANRKALYGIKVYNPLIVNLEEQKLDDGEGVSAILKARSLGYDVDLNKAMVEFRDAPETSNTMTDIANIMELMQRLVPTDILKQVADLERATLYQAAATVQATNRRSHKIAKTINDQAVQNLRFQMMYNNYQFLEPTEIIDPNSGQIVEINPADFRDSGIEMELSDGLRGIDKLMVGQIMRDILLAVLQSQQATQEIDIVSLLNYYTSIMGDKTDLSQFRRQQQQQQPAQPAQPNIQAVGP